MSRQENEQKALDMVAGRKPEAAAAKPAKKGLGAVETMGILLWLLVIVAGGGAAAYFFLLAPK
jgi:hypothetical protein